MTIVTAHDDDINHAVCIGNVNLSVAIHITEILKQGRIVAHALVDDLAVHDNVAQSTVLLVVGLGVGFAGERREQVAHVAAVDADALDDVALHFPALVHVGVSVAAVAVNLNRLHEREVVAGQDFGR